MRRTETFEKRYGVLNAAQKQAVDTIEGPVLVVAGPGSGKTEILSLRVANILRQTDMRPGNVLCLTFTDAAAVNMRKRLTGLIGEDAYRVAIYTFHSFGTEVMQSFPEFFYGGMSLVPADPLAQLEVLESVFHTLSYDDPLSSKRDGSFAYLKDTQSAIGDLRKGGLSPDEFRQVLAHNESVLEKVNPLIDEVFSARISKGSIEQARALVSQITACRVEAFPLPHFESLHATLARALTEAVTQAEEEGKATPLSEWKKKWTEKDEEGRHVVKGTRALPRLFSLASVYEAYRQKMRSSGYYDFDDMILDVVHAVAEHDTLRYELQEQFQYILVDEFQDTNDAQLRLLTLLSDAAIHEDRPNIMAVGDDDQAIYRFQGAELSNILNFRDRYRDPAIVTMTENYRSTQKVLDLARKVIVQGTERLEDKIESLEKTLIAGNASLGEGNIVRKEFRTRLHEYAYVADEIRRIIDAGGDPEDIAVIARKHENLASIAEILQHAGIPVRYERRQNVFREPHVHELIQMARFVASLGRKNMDEADELLPEILSYPFWGLSREVVWDISVQAERARRLRRKWIDVMREHENERVREIAEFFLDLGKRSHYETLESILNALIGDELAGSDVDEDGEIESALREKKKEGVAGASFVSSFKTHHFSKERFETDRVRYLFFLSSLQTFVSALREYKQGKPLRIEDLVAFVDLHEKNNLPVTDQSPFVSAERSVTLLTAHKAKGLEFDTVFVLSCQNDVWAGKGYSSKLPFPKNLPLSPGSDTDDDKLRLFYVALTRAKRHLYITSYQMSEKGKESLPLQFLVPVEFETGEEGEVSKSTLEEGRTILDISWKALLAPPYAQNEEALLRALLEEYQMSVTHLNNFLNVADGGPQIFLERNLLRFPEPKTPSGGYGSAMHKAIEEVYTYLRREGKLPEEAEVLAWFEHALLFERLAERDHRHFVKRGKEKLSAYLRARKDHFHPSHKIEANFREQGVVLGGARITGKIDKMIPADSGEMKVVDLKTGKVFEKWEQSGENAIKLYKYRRQLIFYKLLVEHSRDFGEKYMVREGSLEFVEPDEKGNVHELIAEITQEETDRTRALIEVVYRHITDLHLPDVSKYPKDIKGVLQFEEDLLGKS